MERIVRVETDIAGKKLILETGHLAKQANGAVLVRYADTVVLVTATVSEAPREGIDFFPLTVDYEEKLYAAGKIPGGFFKREGRPSEKGILTCRLIDRPIRPLFPEGFRNDVQIVAMVLSADQENDPDIPALIGAGAALAISDIPFPEPIAGIRVGLNKGEYVVNPTFKALNESDLNLVIAGTKSAIMMVESGANEISEEVILKALQIGHKHIRKVIGLIEELVSKCGKPKKEITLAKPNQDLEKIIRDHFTKDIFQAMHILDKQEQEKALEKVSREVLIEALQGMALENKDALLESLEDEKSNGFKYVIKKIQEEEIRKMIVDEKLRSDGRKLDEVRSINCEVQVLPRTHGTGLFTRGQTQVLTTVTLGAVSEEQRLDGLSPEDSKRYMHHYNFPSFSVGETRPMRGPGRREIGHGALAEKALLPMIPSEDEFPYAFRLVSEILESNGSTSMASVCASTLALMDAGVPIKEPVSGIAMGMVTKDGKSEILTDIQGLEDALGEMDFKVAGTKKGITALQMDIKLKGIALDLLERALDQAKDARLFILDKITECMPQPRPEISPYAPTIFTMEIHPDKIKDVIGPGGKIINKIIKDTGVKIDIEPDGRVYIVAVDKDMGLEAQKTIEDLTKDIEAGDTYLGKVTRTTNFGAFVEILPGREGLVHISQLAPERIDRVEDVVKVGDEIMVKVQEIDSLGRINLTKKGLISHHERGDRPPSGSGRQSRHPYDKGKQPYRR